MQQERKISSTHSGALGIRREKEEVALKYLKENNYEDKVNKFFDSITKKEENKFYVDGNLDGKEIKIEAKIKVIEK